MKLWNLEKTVELEIGNFTFRLDVYASDVEPRQRKLRFSRIETFVLSPRFGDEKCSDADVYISDPFLDEEIVYVSTPEDALKFAIGKLSDQKLE